MQLTLIDLVTMDPFHKLDMVMSQFKLQLSSRPVKCCESSAGGVITVAPAVHVCFGHLRDVLGSPEKRFRFLQRDS